MDCGEWDGGDVCRNCEGADWVCENHEDQPWGGLSNSENSCECGAGSPCPVCQMNLILGPWRQGLADMYEIAARLVQFSERQQEDQSLIKRAECLAKWAKNHPQ